MTQYFWTPAALKKVEQRSVKRVDVETVLCDKTAQVTKGSLPDTFVYQQIQKDRQQLLRVAVGPLEGPEPRARIRTAYYAKVSTRMLFQRLSNNTLRTAMC